MTPYMVLGLNAEIERVERETGREPAHLTMTRRQFEALADEVAVLMPFRCREDIVSVPMYQGIPIKITT